MSVAEMSYIRGFSPADYSKCFISRINEVYFFPIKYRYGIASSIVECCNRLFRYNQLCYCAGMISVIEVNEK